MARTVKIVIAIQIRTALVLRNILGITDTKPSHAAHAFSDGGCGQCGSLLELAVHVRTSAPSVH